MEPVARSQHETRRLAHSEAERILPRRGEVVLCLAILAVMIAVADAISWLAGRSVVDRFQTDIYQAANSVRQLPLLLAAVVLWMRARLALAAARCRHLEELAADVGIED